MQGPPDQSVDDDDANYDYDNDDDQVNQKKGQCKVPLTWVGSFRPVIGSPGHIGETLLYCQDFYYSATWLLMLSLEESNNFDNYLKELGVGFILRQLAQVVFIFIRYFFIFILARSGRTANSHRGQVVKATNSYNSSFLKCFYDKDIL